jgi:hypothetical protein
MKKPKAAPRRRPRFHRGEQVHLLRFLPPILSGSTVAILEVRDVGREYRYQVDSTEYPEKPVWASEDDLAYPMDPGAAGQEHSR